MPNSRSANGAKIPKTVVARSGADAAAGDHHATGHETDAAKGRQETYDRLYLTGHLISSRAGGPAIQKAAMQEAAM